MESLWENADYRLFRHQGPPIGTNAYLLVDAKTRDAMAVDASLGSAEAFTLAAKEQNIILQRIINTHGHWDHVLDNHQFLARAIPIWIHPLDEPMLGAKQARYIPLDLTYVATQASVKINEGDLIPLGHFTFQVLHTPGHTQGGICLYEKNLKILFTGDTLFPGTYGRTDFPGGSDRQMQVSLRRLGDLPPDVCVYPGHGDATTIGAEAWIKNLSR